MTVVSEKENWTLRLNKNTKSQHWQCVVISIAISPKMIFRTFTFLGQTCDNMSQWWPVLWQPFAGLACSVGIAVAVTLIQDLTPPESTVLDFPVLGQLLWLYYCFITRSLDKPVLDLPVPWHSLAWLDCPMTTDVALLFISHFIHWQPLLLDGTCPMTTLRWKVSVPW